LLELKYRSYLGRWDLCCSWSGLQQIGWTDNATSSHIRFSSRVS